jgi:prepilin-type N-terminal cleavage/methylation domain-containing protein
MTEPKKLTMILRIGKNRLPGARRGFTLIEVLLAVSILSIGLVGVLRGYSTSTAAMERVQYDLDAGILLKTAMGELEEKAITQGTLEPGVSSGEFSPADEESLDRKYSAPWLWSRDLQKMDLPIKKGKQDAENKEAPSDAENGPDFYLSKLKLAVVNSGRSPLREISLETYVRTESVKSA